jgi:Rrf2 family transcriptional regulator, iron-sulfur cluster assembly transcription factor
MLSNSCRYGIRAIVYLASQPLSSGKTGIKKISADLDLPTPFLAKILQLLAKQRILSSSKGPHGGFALLKDPRKITLLDIVNTIDGNEIFTNCIIHNGSCKCLEIDKKPCTLHEDYAKIRMDIHNLFRSKTVYDLVKSANNPELVSI